MEQASKIEEILKKASKAFNRHDRLKAEMKQLEQDLNELRRDYDIASGCCGTRMESFYRRVQDRHGRAAA